MPEIHYQYLGESHDASFTEILKIDKGSRYYVFTLKNGKQAFLKSTIVSEDLSTVLWVQEQYTEHEDWPTKLVQALGKAQQQYEHKK